MSSGIDVDINCITVYNELKTRKKYAYIVYRLNDENTQIIVERTGSRDTTKPGDIASYETFIASLPDEECRYVVYDFEYEKSPSEGLRNKICFIFWSPETAKIKQKMLYASSKSGLRKSLLGISLEVQGTDLSEVSYEKVLEKANSFI